MNLQFKNRHLLASVALMFALGCGSTAQADLMTSDVNITDATVIDFSDQGPFISSGGPVAIGSSVSRDIDWFSTHSNSSIGNGTYGVTPNGQWEPTRNGYTGVNISSGAMTYQFNDSPVAVAGGFINYAPGTGTPYIEVLDQNGDVLESYNLDADAPISTPDAIDDGAFRGIIRDQADIYALRVANAYIVLDDLTFSDTGGASVSVPSLSSWGLILLAALLGFVAFNRRRILS
jgi:hypothetical protein